MWTTNQRSFCNGTCDRRSNNRSATTDTQARKRQATNHLRDTQARAEPGQDSMYARRRLRRLRPPTSLGLLALTLTGAASAVVGSTAPAFVPPSSSRPSSPLFSRSSLGKSPRSTAAPSSPPLLFSSPPPSTSDATAVSDADDGPFDWWRQWYPLALTRDLDASRPTKATLLGRELVLWKEGNAVADPQWRCFLDRCPHRLAPLSEGRVDGKTGRLQCAYHGWEFEASGACAKIPQVDPAQPDPNPALQSRRACATALPTLEAQGMLWVWPDTSPDGLAASRTTAPALMDGVAEEDIGYLVVAREMPYGFDTLLENGIDPSHLPWAHHNIISHRSQAAFIDIKVDGGIRRDGFDSADFFPKKQGILSISNNTVSTAAAAAAEERGGAPKGAAAPTATKKKTTIPVPQSLHFRPPSLLYQVVNVTEVLNTLPLLRKRERAIRIVTYAVPVAPGRSKVIYRFLRNYFLPPKPFRAWLRWPPEWAEHLRILRVLDSDTVFLHGQERELRLLAGEEAAATVDIDRAYYMPTPADGSVRALRRWIAKYGGPKWLVPELASTLPPLERDRRRLLDRYESHTKQCKVCRGALKTLGRLRHGIGFLSVMAFYLGLLGQSIYTRLAGGFLTVLGLTGALIVQKWEEKFIFQDWDHSKNH